MNWGKGIVFGMLLFMTFIISMSVYMFNIPADDYDHQYYEKGLNFNKDYIKEKQVISDNAKPTVKQLNREIKIAFKQPAIGTVKFINPLGKNKDVLFELNTGIDTSAAIPLKSLTKGQWAVRIEWTSSNKEYLHQQDIYINAN